MHCIFRSIVAVSAIGIALSGCASAPTAIDVRFPDGADYVVVPATRDDAALFKWIAQQAANGATIVSICNGSQVVAKSAAMEGHMATGHCDDWSARHDSDAFYTRFGSNLSALATTVYRNGWFHERERIGVPVAAGVNEVALALTVDAYSSTGRSQAFIVADNDAA